MNSCNYYAITDNSRQCNRFVFFATRLVFKWINRKSQRRAYNWEGFWAAAGTIGWPTSRIRKDLNPCCCSAEALRAMH